MSANEQTLRTLLNLAVQSTSNTILMQQSLRCAHKVKSEYYSKFCIISAIILICAQNSSSERAGPTCQQPDQEPTGRRMPVKHPMSMWAGGRSAESNPKILSRTPRTNARALHRRPQTRQTEAFFWPQRPRRNSHQAEDSAAAAALLCRVGGGVDKAKNRRAPPASCCHLLDRPRDRGFRHMTLLVLGREPETRLLVPAARHQGEQKPKRSLV